MGSPFDAASLEQWPVACLQWQQHSCVCTAINQRALEILGLSHVEPGSHALDLIETRLRPEERSFFRRSWQEASRQQTALHWHAAGTFAVDAQPDGQGCWNAVLQVSQVNDLARTALDITEAIPVGTYTMVLEPNAGMAQFRFMSERFLELTGLRREDALADPMRAFACVHPDDFDAWVQLNAEAFASKSRFFGETRLIVNGDVRWITAESLPRDLADGSTVWEGVLIDVTERVAAQERLRQSQTVLERILNNIPVALAVQDLRSTEQRTTFVNASFERILGYALEEVKTLAHWAELAYPDPSYRKRVFESWNPAMERARANAGMIEQAEYCVRRKDGRDLQMLISAVVIDDNALIALVDVTAVRDFERKLLESLERERANEGQVRKILEEKLRISLSATAVAHEIRQPLSIILFKCKQALSAISRQSLDLEAASAVLHELADQAAQMSVITERITMLLRNVETQRTPLDLCEMVRAAALPLGRALNASGIALVFELPTQVTWIQGDAVQLQLALANLLRNSIEAIRLSSPAEPKIRLAVRAESSGWLLEVADNGPGFAQGFDPTEPLVSTKADGSGIGLYVVQLTMANHGGTMQIGRCPDLGGAVVRLQVPG